LKSRGLPFVSARYDNSSLLDAVLAFDKFAPLEPHPLDNEVKLFLDIKWWDSILFIQRSFPNRSFREWDVTMRSRWGRKLFKPCDLDGYEVV
jgi:hypothetical protein